MNTNTVKQWSSGQLGFSVKFQSNLFITEMSLKSKHVGGGACGEVGVTKDIRIHPLGAMNVYGYGQKYTHLIDV